MDVITSPFWFLVRLWECIRGQGHTWSTSLAEYRGYRRHLGGRWGLWECTKMDTPFTIWWPSVCEHYPPPPLVNSTEPLKTEDYIEGRRLVGD